MIEDAGKPITGRMRLHGKRANRGSGLLQEPGISKELIRLADRFIDTIIENIKCK